MSATAAANLEAMRAELVARIKTAADAALGLDVPVHPFERYARKPADLRRYYVTGGRLVGWHVRRVASLELEDDAQFTRTVHRFRAVALMGLNDPDTTPGSETEASEIAFDRMLECVRAAFRDDDALVDSDDALLAETSRYEGRQGFQIDDSGPAMFADVLCHMARCSIAMVCSEAVGVEATDDFERAGLDIATFSQDQRYLDGSQADVGPRVPDATDPDHDFEDVTEVQTS